MPKKISLNIICLIMLMLILPAFIFIQIKYSIIFIIALSCMILLNIMMLLDTIIYNRHVVSTSIYRQILSQIKGILILIGPDGNLLYANKLAMKYLKAAGKYAHRFNTNYFKILTAQNDIKEKFNRLLTNGVKQLSANLAIENDPIRDKYIKCQLVKISSQNKIVGILIIGKEPDSLVNVSRLYGISPRELEIIRHVLAGNTNRQTAGRLHITEQTVKAHLTNVYNKVGVDNKVQLFNAVLDN